MEAAGAMPSAPAGFSGVHPARLSMISGGGAAPSFGGPSPFNNQNAASMLGGGGGGAAGALSQATRQARRLYVGGILPGTREDDVRVFFNRAMATANLNHEPGDSVVSVYLNHEKKFGFVEFRTTGEATAAMSLDGINFHGQSLKVRRPSDYTAAVATPTPLPLASPLMAMAGMAGMGMNVNAMGGMGMGGPMGAMGAMGMGGPKVELDVSRLGIVSTQVPDGPNKVFCGGLPYDLSENDVKELLSAYGPLKAFHLVRDKESAMSKGYCFFEYADPSVTDGAIAGLNGIQIGSKTLTIRRAVPRGESAPTMPLAGLGMMGMNPMMMPMGMPQQPATRVLVMLNMVTPEELQNEEEYKEIFEDIELECKKYGEVLSVSLPRPGEPGVGKVFVEFADASHAARARAEIEGRQFASRTVLCQYMDPEQYARKAFA